MIINYYCNECNCEFHHSSAYVIESVGFMIYECPRCGSRLTKPVIEKGANHDSSNTGEINRE